MTLNGIANSLGFAQFHAARPMQCRSGGSSCHPLSAVHHAPGSHSLGAGGTFVFGIAVVSAMLEVIDHLVVNRHETLQMKGRFEPAHDLLAHACRLMRILRSAVQSFVLAVLKLQTQVVHRCSLALKFFGDLCPWQAVSSDELSHHSLGGLSVAQTLHQYVENGAVLIDGTPQPSVASIDTNNYLVQIPLSAKGSLPMASVPSNLSPEFQCSK